MRVRDYPLLSLRLEPDKMEKLLAVANGLGLEPREAVSLILTACRGNYIDCVRSKRSDNDGAGSEKPSKSRQLTTIAAPPSNRAVHEWIERIPTPGPLEFRRVSVIQPSGAPPTGDQALMASGNEGHRD